ncbi:AraC family transcriptional regulator [Flavobacteriaceae bacterium 144Ye]|nr:AraC family transcriptional regulator [Flavobacteriaceae bacterium 144Ye]
MAVVFSTIYNKAIQLALSEGLTKEHLNYYIDYKVENKRVPMELLLEVYELASDKLQAGFGLRQGKQLDTTDYGTLGLSWKTCLKAIDVLNNVKRYMVLVTDDGSIELDESEGKTKLVLNREVYRTGIKTANEASFVMLVGILNEVTGKNIKPIEVNFKHSFSSSDYFSEYFDCPVNFNATENTLIFNSNTLEVSTIKADKFIHQFLLERMEQEKSKLSEQEDVLTSEINKLLKESMSSGIPSISQVGDYLGMSARTLKRRLADRNLSFRELIQKNQHETATQLLSNSSQSVGEIAFLTGFSEQSAFNRAFKRWTGQAPNEYRKNL